MKALKNIFICLMCVLLLAGCGQTITETYEEAPVPAAEEPAAGKADDTQAEAAEQDAEEEAPADSAEESPAGPFAGEVLIDCEACLMEVTGFDPEDEWGSLVSVRCENRTEGDLYFSVLNAAVNMYMFDPYWAICVPAGETKDGEIVFYASSLKALGISDIESVALMLDVFSDASDAESSVASGTFTFYPTGLNAQTVEIPEYEMQEGAKTALKTDKMVFRLSDDGGTGKFPCYIENNTEYDMIVSIDNVKINSVSIDPQFARIVLAGCRYAGYIKFDSEEYKALEAPAGTMSFRVLGNEYKSYYYDVIDSCSVDFTK